MVDVYISSSQRNSEVAISNRFISHAMTWKVHSSIAKLSEVDSKTAVEVLRPWRSGCKVV